MLLRMEAVFKIGLGYASMHPSSSNRIGFNLRTPSLCLWLVFFLLQSLRSFFVAFFDV